MFHPYIYKVRDVRADGNCGFRAVAVGLNLHENAWPTVRYHLMEELRIYYNQYVVMLGTKEVTMFKSAWISLKIDSRQLKTG
ncbi:hypothetical protein CTI12_AA361730 [Artemisia annua]|uniref:OTU domain-containing protein n=1 Tax=Artemisia annua TaxID=35608 RepID=A0A2U1M429_ARTAN|nr:hypothetical protein CTI12_AA361730 [Artemisia annua]